MIVILHKQRIAKFSLDDFQNKLKIIKNLITIYSVNFFVGFFRLVFFFVLTSLTTFVLLTPSAYSDNIFIDPMPGEFGHFGRSVVTGDFNGDQVTDLIVGANERLLCGKIVFFEGPDFERNITYHDPRSPCSQGFTSHFGRTLASGDV
ncbi:MAG: hypothetical protein GWN56_16255, partial [Nitrosopumilaceae archaeon]|nr:hypothetical protein [Nitrosopumilaceae archaeon]